MQEDIFMGINSHTSYSGFIMSTKGLYNPENPYEEARVKVTLLKAFGENLKRLRKQRRLTQESLGELTGINYKYIGEIERGEKNPTAVVIYKISKALQVPVSEIFSLEEDTSEIGERIKTVERLFEGRDKREIDKAIRILKVFFE